MMNYCLLTNKDWHDKLFSILSKREKEKWYRVNHKEDFNVEFLREKCIKRVFIPHWSYLIGEEIYSNFECIVFHMTDLPYGRGGSPLQNLIVRGFKETKISAIKVRDGIDTGDIYLKKPLSLSGTASEIFLRSVPIIQEMIEFIIDDDINPHPQTGEIVEFQRRGPEQGDLAKLSSLSQVYDHIRMLDCEGYPPAFIESNDLKLEFREGSLNSDGTINANVRISKK